MIDADVTIDKASSTPLYIQIENVLNELISSGQLSPGSRVPSELEVASQYQVSRMTARKALERLVAKGLLFRQRGKGTFVPKDLMSYTPSSMLSFSSVMRARGYEVSTKVLQQEVIPGPKAVLERLHLRPRSEVILIRRLRFVEGIPIAIHTAFLEYPAFARLLEVDLSSNSLLLSIEQLFGTRAAYSKDSVWAAIASREEAFLLDLHQNSPVLRMEGVTYTENGVPTRYNKAVYRGDNFRMVITNRNDHTNSFSFTDIPSEFSG